MEHTLVFSQDEINIQLEVTINNPDIVPFLLDYEIECQYEIFTGPIPEPGTYLLLGSMLMIAAIAKRRRLEAK